MRKTVIDLFDFKELKKDVREKVLSKFRDINVSESFWDDEIKNKWKTKLEKLGYTNVKIMYSGFGSQGDGACFTAGVDVKKWLAKHKKEDLLKAMGFAIEEVTINITHSWRYYFSTSTDVIYEVLGSAQKHESDINKVSLDIEAERAAIGNKIYAELQNAYFDLSSDSSVEKAITANGYEFMDNGYLYA